MDSEIISDRGAIANGFNNYFVSIGSMLASKILSNVNPISYIKSINNRIVIPTITCHEVYQVICFLKNSSADWDDFPTVVLKKCYGSLLQPLTHLINCSLQSGIFPDKLKLARVVPIFKAGDLHAQVSTIPISILTTFPKIFERIVYNHFLDFLSKNEALYKYQVGFRPSHSTQHAIVTLVDRGTKSLDNGNIAVAVLLDLKVIEKCTNFYFGTEKLPPKFYDLISIVKKKLGMLATKSFFSVRFGVAELPSLLPYR